MCATRIVENLARRAFRRPVTAEDVNPLMAFYKAGSATGGFEGGVRDAVSAILASPHFLYRAEAGATGAVRTINDLLAALPDGPFPLRLTEADLGPGQPAGWTCRPLTDSGLPEAYPSEKDVEQMEWTPDQHWLIVGLTAADAEPEVRSFRLADGQVVEDELAVVESYMFAHTGSDDVPDRG